ncbi:MAG TPA: hydroxymethylglutaryl-CoA synthase [Polyangiaceae bacterium]|nr:hydroxymethylglutaryl-CoA synthase [Polyangiaceae bacterium]
MIGIVGYGAYVPRYRVRIADVAAQWGRDADAGKKGDGLVEKTVPGMDEDTITIAVAAGRRALARADVAPRGIGALYIGSESHPYAVKPSGTVVAEALGIGPNVHVADFEFACKAGTEAMFCALSHVRAGEMDLALAIGADTSQGAPSDPLEYTASAGGAAYLFGRGEGVLAEILHTHSLTSDTPDFWRREGRAYPSHAGRYTGQPAYFKHLLGCARATLEKSGLTAADVAHVVFHMPNDKFPLAAAKELGFTRAQLDLGFLVREMGNSYSGSSPTGLAAVLDGASADQVVLLVSYGSGSGSDGFVLRTTPALAAARARAPFVKDELARRRAYLDYGTYAKYRGKYRLKD